MECNKITIIINNMYLSLYFLIVWAETGDFRDNTHNSMAAVASSIDITQLHFQSSSTIRNKNRDRKSDGNFFCST